MSFRNIYRNPLGNISKNNSRNPTPGRKREKDLVPIPPNYPKPQEPVPEKPFKEISFMINLEDLVVLERTITHILDNLNNSFEASAACQDFWDLTSQNTLNQVSSLYRNEKKKIYYTTLNGASFSRDFNSQFFCISVQA